MGRTGGQNEGIRFGSVRFVLVPVFCSIRVFYFYFYRDLLFLLFLDVPFLFFFFSQLMPFPMDKLTHAATLVEAFSSEAVIKRHCLVSIRSKKKCCVSFLGDKMGAAMSYIARIKGISECTVGPSDASPRCERSQT